MKKILIITNIFPDKNHLYRGIFIKEQIDQLKDKYEIKVLFPIPYLSIFFEFIYRIFTGKKLGITLKLSKQQLGYTVEKVYYLYIPYISHFLKLLSLYISTISAKWQPDFLLTYYVLEHGYLATKLGQLLNKPAVIYAIGSDINCFFYQHIPIGQRIKDRGVQALNNCQKVIAASNDLKKKIIKLGIESSKIEVVPFGVDQKIFYPVPQKQTRQDLNLSLRSKIILYIGSLALSKGLFYLIQAFRKVKDKLPNTQLILIGEGSDKSTLLCLTKTLNLRRDVRFYGSKPHKEINLWIAGADIVCLPSFSEGMPLVIKEALCCGKPVVATKIGGVMEVIKRSDIGFLVEPKNSRQLADVLIEGLKKQWDKKKIIASGELFAWDKIKPKLVSVLDSVKS